MHFLERAEAFGSAAWWFVGAALALAVVPILADLVWASWPLGTPANGAARPTDRRGWRNTR